MAMQLSCLSFSRQQGADVSGGRASLNLTEKEVKDLREIFDLMDKDSGGTLSIEEIKQLMEMLGMKMPPDELEDLVASIDVDGSGQVDFEVR